MDWFSPLPQSQWTELDRIVSDHYEKAMKEVEELIRGLTQELGKLGKLIIVFESPLPSWLARTPNSINREFWRRGFVLHRKYRKYGIQLTAERIAAVERNLEILKSIRSTLTRLRASRARYVLCLPRLGALERTVGPSRAVWKVRTLRYALAEVRSAIEVLPDPFEEEALSASVLRVLLTNITQLWDSVSGYLPETPDLELFSRVFGNPISVPMPISEFEALPLACKISFSVEKLVQLLGIRDSEEAHVLELAAARHFMGLVADIPIQRPNLSLLNYLRSLRQSFVSELCPTCPFLAIEQSPGDFLRSQPMLSPALAHLFDTCFMCAPDDIAQSLHQIHLRFSAFAAAKIGTNLSSSSVSEAERSLWKLLFISSDLPTLDSLICSLENRRRLPVFQGEIFRQLANPMTVWQTLTHDTQLSPPKAKSSAN
jgi:hypothetical protein